MVVSRKRAKLRGKSINNRNYPIIITTFGNGTLSKCLKTRQFIDRNIIPDKEDAHKPKLQKARSITHYKVLS